VKKLENRVALVTGAGRNLGRGIAIALAREGATVAVNGLSNREKLDEVVSLIEQEGGKAMPYLADVGEPDQIARMVEDVSKELGAIDLLVSNAAIRPRTGGEITPEVWRRIIAVNLDATFFLCQATIRGMIEKGGGSIIAMSGLAAFGIRQTGIREARPGSLGGPNAAAKAGLIGLMRGVANGCGIYNVRANTVVIGNMATEQYDQNAYLEGRASTLLHTKTNEGMEAVPLNRRGLPEEAGATCVFLSSADGGYITGQTIHLNGGLYMA
jgi:NAD(P)-dependent dehydrogenase (short-subunit alcohol dehydrogenase family)